MKIAIRELGSALIVLFALNLNAQTLVGLPELGVTLSGTPDNPIIENHSAQAIIGHTLRVYFAANNARIPMNFANLKTRDIWSDRNRGIEPNRTEAPLFKYFAATRPTTQFHIQGQVMHDPTRVILDAVVFANGQVVGPDVVGKFSEWTAQLEILQELATFALQARQNPSLQPALWLELDRLIGSREDLWKRAFAADLRNWHIRSNDEEVYKSAGRIMAIPTLWRTR